jgi:Flp pilus assembly CpaF family ATPase
VTADLVRLLRREVAEQLSARAAEFETLGRPAMDEADRRELGRALIDEALERHQQRQLALGRPLIEAAAEDEVAAAVHAALFGAGRLEPLLADPDIENINVNGYDRVWLTYADGTKTAGPPIADSDDELVELVRLMAVRLGLNERRFDAGSPRLNLRLPDGSRLSAVMGVSTRPAISIRRHRFTKVFLDDMVRLGAIDDGLRAFLEAAVLARKNVVVSGGTNAGKTTLLRALANAVPGGERLVTIEKSLELGLHELGDLHPDVVALEAREPNAEGEGEVTMAELVQHGLRMDPSRVIVGEVLGDEILSMLNAMSQGNDGSMCTIHATSSEYTFSRIATYAIQSAERLPVEATVQLIAGSVDFVVFIGQRDLRARGGPHLRYVSSVREVLDADGPNVVSNEVFRPGPDGRAIPGAPIRCIDELMLHGYQPGWHDAGLTAAGGWER